MNSILKESFFFVRHAETDWNNQKLCQGQRDIPLNERGKLQARLLAERSRNLKIECIVTSPLQRALETAKELHQVHKDAELHIVYDLQERNWGDFEGISSEEMYTLEELEEKDPFYSPGNNIEPRRNFQKRILHGILTAQSFHAHPLIVGHGRAFLELCYCLGIPPIRQIPNCHILEIFPTNNSWKTRVI
ncbi:MAG: histidine phosphatase family protein [Chlamydiota bacterium]|jgi:broad specificity phosphatase PhoE